MNTVDVLNIIKDINNSSGIKNPVAYYLNGGCYIFAKKLQNIIGGNILYLINEQHFVLKSNNLLFDSSGNVTNQFINSKYITENQFMSRKKLKDSIKLS